MSDQLEKPKATLSGQVTRFLFIILAINTVVTLFIAGAHFKKEYKSLMQSRVDTVGGGLKTFMEEILSLGLPLGVLEGVEKELSKTVLGDLQALYANVVDENSLVVYSFPERKINDPFYPEHIMALVKNNKQQTFATTSAYNTFIPLLDPISERAVGGINIGIPKKYVLSKTMESVGTLILIFISFIFVTLLFFSWITKKAIKPLVDLTDSALALGKGDFSVRLHVEASNEIGSLAESFNYMAQQLENDHLKLTDYTSQLEGQNEELKQAQQRILQREEKLKSAQSQLVHSEKMASLGLLIAGVAHEINTPAGAISNVASELGERMRVITSNFKTISEYSADDLSKLCTLTEELNCAEFSPEGGGQWKKSRAVRKWLEEIGVENAKEVVDILSKYNLFDIDQLESYESLLKKPNALNFMDSIATVNVGMKICESSIKKISEIVKALKYYAYTDMDKTSLVDLNENIDNVLLLMKNKLKYNIELEKDFKNLPRIQCTSDINQAWTNLISNAHDAIMESKKPDEKGKIRVATGRDNGFVKVQVTDSGAGIPEEIKAKIFDPFYTTKDIGKGTGLGLSIVSGIITKHRGSIDIESSPGKTTFTVSLPVENQERAASHAQ